MAETDLFAAYVRTQLDRWGHEFALHRDAEMLGHQSRNMLATIIEHGGEMPSRPTGFKPLTVDRVAMMVEDVVRELAMDDMVQAMVLRAYYCGRGRQAFERREIAEELTGLRLSKQRYFILHKLGFDAVCKRMQQLAQAA